MKNRFILLVIISTISLKATPLLKDVHQAYESKQFALALKMSKAFIKKHPEDIHANLILANSAFFLNNHHEAMAGYDRILMIEPDHIYSRIQMAKIFKQAGNKKLLEAELEYLSTLRLSGKQKKTIETLSQNSSAKTQPKRNYSGALSVGLFYDNNINADIGAKPFNVPAINLTLQGAKKEKGLAHFQNLFFHAHATSKTDESLRLQGSFNLYNKDYFKKDYAANDLTFASLKVAPTYQIGGYALALPIRLEALLLDYTTHAKTFGIGIEAKRLFDWGFLSTGLELKTNRYAKEKDRGKDSDETSIYIEARKSGKSYQLSTILNFDTAKEKEDLRSDVSYRGYGISVDYYQQIVTNLLGRVSFKAQRYNYKDFNNKFLNKREDALVRFGIGSTYSLSEQSSISMGIDYLKRNSNQIVYGYDKLTYSTYYTYQF